MQEYKVLLKKIVPQGLNYLDIVGEQLENDIQELISGQQYRLVETTTSTVNNIEETIQDVRFESEETFQNFFAFVHDHPLPLQRVRHLRGNGGDITVEVVGYVDV